MCENSWEKKKITSKALQNLLANLGFKEKRGGLVYLEWLDLNEEKPPSILRLLCELNPEFPETWGFRTKVFGGLSGFFLQVKFHFSEKVLALMLEIPHLWTFTAKYSPSKNNIFPEIRLLFSKRTIIFRVNRMNWNMNYLPYNQVLLEVYPSSRSSRRMGGKEMFFVRARALEQLQKKTIKEKI